MASLSCFSLLQITVLISLLCSVLCYECESHDDCLPGQICSVVFGRNICYDFPLFMQGRRKRSATWCTGDSECGTGMACKNRFCEPVY